MKSAVQNLVGPWLVYSWWLLAAMAEGLIEDVASILASIGLLTVIYGSEIIDPVMVAAAQLRAKTRPWVYRAARVASTICFVWLLVVLGARLFLLWIFN